MSLLRLPTETLRQIFDQLDSSFFQEDLGRLTVNKKWFDLALPACLKCIALSREALWNLVVSKETKRPSSLENNLEALSLDLRGYDSDLSNARGSTSQPRSPQENPAKAWERGLNDDLSQLAVMVQRSPRLRTLRVRAWSYPSAYRFPLEGYLSLSTMRALLSVENLGVLVLDLAGTSLDPSAQQVNEHICPFISDLLRTLQTLHLRMRSICPDVLKIQEPDKKLRLSAVVINLSLDTRQSDITSAAHSVPCGSLFGGLIQLRDDIQKQAEVLVTHMESPKTMRILTHTLPQFDTLSLDVLTGKIMRLEDDASWDEDGKTVREDSEPESEISDEEFDGFFDD
ncbi:uncharacterized protein FMAN_02157 [Fusarium mangiferae]|uniref:F-box domain-containing protein n=1 Tax=Fusarium mangiferae TaxID=192010 RepID=A0A1L7TL45_FUSMA|nr:uncharacterized protein FMAN_02157 [Fusarium mangiferae]CVK99304.1 uncharacterized protein FMAN_02157 [Fusarium mangiferae]